MANEHLDEVVGLLISIPPTMLRKLHRDVFKTVFEQAGADMAPHHMIIMKVLQESGPLHVTEIAEELAIAKPQMTHSTDKLISLGMIERQPDKQDRRKINIKLTTKGRETIEKLQQIMRDRMKEKLSFLTDDDLERLAASLRNMADIFAKVQ